MKSSFLCITLALTSGAAMAQTGTISLGDGTVIHGDGSGKATVRVNGQVINAASGEGSVAETNIGSRSSTARGAAGQTSIVTIDENGTRTQVTTHAPAKSSSAGGAPASGDFVNADLSGRNFANAKLAGRKFTNVDLSNANLQGADLRGAQFINVDLAGANLTGANLTGARLVNTDVEEAITTGVIWKGR